MQNVESASIYRLRHLHQAPPKTAPNTNKRRVGRDRSKSGAQEIVNDMSFTLEINQKAGDLVAPCTKG